MHGIMYRMSEGRKREAYYDYNGIGQRTGRIIDGARENYLIDFTKPYHNLLSVTKSDSTSAQTFYWDGNVAAIEETVNCTIICMMKWEAR